MRHKTSQELFAYWNRRRGRRSAPSRLEIEPADIRALLPDVFILQAEADGALTFRLAGTGLCALFDRELRGEALERLWVPDSSEAATNLASGVLQGLVPGVVELLGESRAGRAVSMEMLLVPLADESLDNRRILGSLSAIERPYWLALDPVVSLVATSVRVLDVEKERIFLASRPKISLEAAPARFRGPATRPQPRRFHHLTLIEGGRA